MLPDSVSELHTADTTQRGYRDSHQRWWPSPAKLNLFLHITGRRDDGYHQLQTLFQFLDHGDRLAFQITDDGSLALDPPLPGVADEDNLVLRAARLLQQAAGPEHDGHKKRGAVITLDKQLPMGGGIGGGSSNAATTLVALNHLWQTGLSENQLAELGLALGADVPVFVRGLAAFAEGVGEKLTPVSPPEYWYLVLRPACHISTPAVFTDPALTRDTPLQDGAKLCAQLPEQWRNDCESVVLKKYPEVERALDWLVSSAPARMTGTGSCVFAVFDSEEAAQQCLLNKPEDFQGFVARGCNTSPLKSFLQREVSGDTWNTAQ